MGSKKSKATVVVKGTEPGRFTSMAGKGTVEERLEAIRRTSQLAK